MAQILQLALCWTAQAVAGALEALGRRGPVSPATCLLLIAPDLLWSASSRMCSLPATMQHIVRPKSTQFRWALHSGLSRGPRGLGGPFWSYPCSVVWMAVIDVAGYVAELKDHAVDHGFHVHDERHFVETYSLRQAWEVDLHPEEACNGPLDLHLALEVDPRVLLSFEDAVVELPEGADPPDEYHFPLTFTWALPPLPHGPDLLHLAIDLAGIGGVELPLETSAIDSYPSATDAAERRLTVIARQKVSLARVLAGEELLCDSFDRALAVSHYLLESAPAWMSQD